RYRFFDFETQFNRAGYNLMGSSQMQGALFVFQLNAELFPGSANVWDSLAEAFMKSGNTAKAVEYYNKAIQLDPEGPTGKNAREILKTLQKN
ncbi:MAG: tetratricopeptide repeat protein, partial [Sinomicrobium sp.]|nr:tetratricopeptide repeat protein [Sinomicrobium sp.]